MYKKDKKDKKALASMMMMDNSYMDGNKSELSNSFIDQEDDGTTFAGTENNDKLHNGF